MGGPACAPSLARSVSPVGGQRPFRAGMAGAADWADPRSTSTSPRQPSAGTGARRSWQRPQSRRREGAVQGACGMLACMHASEACDACPHSPPPSPQPAQQPAEQHRQHRQHRQHYHRQHPAAMQPALLCPAMLCYALLCTPLHRSALLHASPFVARALLTAVASP